MHGIRQAKRAGARVLALDGDPSADGFAIADQSLCVDIVDPEATVAAVRASGVKPAGVISFATEIGLKSAAAIRQAFDLPGPNSEQTRKLTDKQAQRHAWDKAGLPNPTWRAIKSRSEAEAAISDIGLPVIVKPADSAGSRGVTKLDKFSDWQDAVDHAFAQSPGGKVMIEQFIEGLECTVETFSHHQGCSVLLITEKIKVPGTGGTVAGELRTPGFGADTVKALRDTAPKALAALGYTDGPGHTEIIVRDNGDIFLVEAAGRGAGFMVFDAMVPSASGVDLATACVEQALGMEPVLPTPKNTAVVLRFFPSRPGRITGIHGFDEANAIPDVTAAPFVSVGHVSGHAAADGDRLGYILACAGSRDIAIKKADQAEKAITIGVETCP